jgi:general secretion pathway protein A
MYESFYGLRERPFNITPDPHFLYLGVKHREALAHLLYGVKEKKGFIVITGEVGTGKTTLIHSLLARVDGDSHIKTAFLFNSKLNVDDLIHYILKDLGLNVDGGSKGALLHALHNYLMEEYQKDKNVVLIVDEAQGLSPELLEEIRLLSNLETAKSKLLQIVLIGQPELDKTLALSSFRQLRQRINMRYHLYPLSVHETKEYIQGRLKIAGAKRPIFTQRALREVYRKSGGVPRLINILCDNALLNGYSLDEKVVDRKLVKDAARDMELKKSFSRRWIGALLGMGLLGIVVLLFNGQKVSDLFSLLVDHLPTPQDLQAVFERVADKIFRFFS